MLKIASVLTDMPCTKGLSNFFIHVIFSCLTWLSDKFVAAIQHKYRAKVASLTSHRVMVRQTEERHMSIDKAVGLGLVGNELSKKLTGTDEVSAGRSAVATSAGAILGSGVAVTAVAVGFTSAPITVPLALASGACALVASWFD